MSTPGVLSPASAGAGYYPPRPAYDYENYLPEKNACADLSNPAVDHGRCGPVDGPVFDSFINVPFAGDERGFFDAVRTDQTAAGSHHDPLYFVAGGSREVELRVLVDNDANEYAGYKTTAQETRLQVELPQSKLVGRDLRAVALISAANATPHTVEDTVDLIDPRPFRVEYVPGSAVLYRHKGSEKMDDAVVSGGTLITNKQLAGVFVAGFSKEVAVHLRLRIIPAVSASHPLRWVILLTLAVAGLLAVVARPAARRRVVKTARGWWGWGERHGIGVQILSNVMAAGLIAAFVWLIAHLF